MDRADLRRVILTPVGSRRPRDARGREPWVNMSHRDSLADDWKAAMVRYPDCFVPAFDNVWPERWSDLYVQRAQLWRRALSQLPRPIAEALAHGNAERLWRIPPGQRQRYARAPSGRELNVKVGVRVSKHTDQAPLPVEPRELRATVSGAGLIRQEPGVRHGVGARPRPALPICTRSTTVTASPNQLPTLRVEGMRHEPATAHEHTNRVQVELQGAVIAPDYNPRWVGDPELKRGDCPI